MRGGVIVDFVYEKYRMGNLWVKEVLTVVLDGFYKVMMNQIIAWVLYG
jgi:hypothetical protein